MLRCVTTDLPGVLLIEPAVYTDARGFFIESYHCTKFRDRGLNVEFVQDNHSYSVAGVLRGLHYQLAKPQGKLVHVIRGAIHDVAVDVRKDSPSLGRHVGIELSEGNHHQLYIPPGFAHGFCVLSSEAHVVYKCTDYYDPSSERTILWNDPELAIPWPVKEPILSEKDALGRAFADAELVPW